MAQLVTRRQATGQSPLHGRIEQLRGRNGAAAIWQYLRLTCLFAEFEAQEPAQLPPFKGSTIRGALGHALKHLSCLEPHAVCETCNNNERCAYGILFEDAGESGSGKGLVPYVLAVPLTSVEQFRPGDRMLVGVTLIGHARAALAWLPWALSRLGAEGLGAGRSRWRLIDVRSQDPAGHDLSLFGELGRCPQLTGDDLCRGSSLSERVRLEFLTPTQLKSGGRLTTDITGELLARRLVRRIHQLADAFCGFDSTQVDFPLLMEAAKTICSENVQLRLHDWERYSTRKRNRHSMAGVVGSLTLSNIPEALRPYFDAGQWLHVGKSASFGMGQYRLEPLADA